VSPVELARSVLFYTQKGGIDDGDRATSDDGSRAMSDFFSDPKSALIALLGILGGIVTWLFKREVRRIDKALAESVRREEFNQWRGDMDRRHEENIDRLDRIEAATTGTHKRIDELYRDLVKNRQSGK